MRGLTYSLLLAVLFAGCGTAYEAARRSGGSAKSASEGQSAAGGEKAALAGAIAPASPASDRKIIYVGEVRLVVEDFAETQEKIPALVQSLGGYLAQVQIQRATGEQRYGHWVARLPVAQYESFLERLDDIGVAESREQTAQDVTEEFVDLEARIRNAKQIEQRLLKLLEDRTGEIKDVVEVETKLGQVRGEVEQMEGRLRYLTNRTDLTTVTIHAREERDYQPPAAPSLGSRVSRGWENSLVALRHTGEALAVGLVVAAPWILVAAILGTPLLWLLRRTWRQRRASRGTPAQPSSTGK